MPGRYKTQALRMRQRVDGELMGGYSAVLGARVTSSLAHRWTTGPRD